MKESLIQELNRIAQKMFGVNYNQLGTFGKWEVEAKLRKSNFLLWKKLWQELNQNKEND